MHGNCSSICRCRCDYHQMRTLTFGQRYCRTTSLRHSEDIFIRLSQHRAEGYNHIICQGWCGYQKYIHIAVLNYIESLQRLRSYLTMGINEYQIRFICPHEYWVSFNDDWKQAIRHQDADLMSDLHITMVNKCGELVVTTGKLREENGSGSSPSFYCLHT